MTERGWHIPVLERGVPSPWDVGPPDSVCFSSPKQAVVSSKPNFWTHSLQIHCNGLGSKTVTLQLLFKEGTKMTKRIYFIPIIKSIIIIFIVIIIIIIIIIISIIYLLFILLFKWVPYLGWTFR